MTPNKNNLKDSFIILPLPNFYFHHSPSEIDEKDNRLVGREKLKKEFKSIFNNDISSKGVYLVTGYRGMGKTSFVNQTLLEITRTYNFRPYFLWLFQMLIITFGLSFINYREINSAIRGGCGFFLMLYIGYYIYSVLKTTIPIGRRGLLNWYERGYFNLRPFILPKRRYKPGLKYLKYALEFFHIALFILLINLSNSSSYLAFWKVYSLSAILVFFGGLLLKFLFKEISEIRNSKIKKEGIIPFFVSKLKPAFNFNRLIVIRVNFSQTDLNELNIFKVLANSLEEKYRELQIKHKRSLFYGLLKWLLLYILFGCFYYSDGTYEYIDTIKRETAYHDWLKYEILTKNQIIKDGIIKDYKFNVSNTSLLKRGVNNIEIITQNNYRKIYNFFSKYIGSETINFSNYFTFFTAKGRFFIIPQYLDFVFILTFLLFVFSIKFIFNRIHPFSISRKILKQLKELNENIDSSIEYETGISGNFADQSVNRVKKTSSSKVTVREIERRLLSILEKFNKIPRFSQRPEFVFIFDELDKIEFNSELLTTLDSNKFRTSSNSREKQKIIFQVLSNLKFFFTTANAKFIFIAGNELYDSSLSDESDRFFLVSSMFNKVIYIESLLNGSSRNDITTNIENYVCNCLIPYSYRKGNGSLSLYNRYLHHLFKLETSDSKKSTKTKSDVAFEKEREIILLAINHFIVYLTHKSSGVPKKMTKIFETYVKEFNKNELETYSYLGFKAPETISCYLVLSSQDQHITSFYNYLISPINLIVNNQYKELGDKLLLSIVFLTNHILKYHKSGFSWRNLEVSPEILDINKVPELRQFTVQIIKYFTSVHLNENISGLFKFKFNKYISNEISYISKISDSDSSIFNFSYDESYPLKSYYIDLIHSMRDRYSNGYNDESATKYVHSIALLHTTLADLFYYEGDYSNAVVEYLESIQYLRNMKEENFKIHHLLILIRNMLKLALVYEKRKTHSSALLTYSDLTTRILEFKNIDLEQFFLTLKVNNGRGLEIEKKKNEDLINEDFNSFTQDHFNIQSFNENFFEILTKKKLRILNNISAFDNLKLLYQPFLAKLYSIEKNALEGVSVSDLKRLLKEFDYAYRTSSYTDQYLIISDFWMRVSHLLYYKNSDISIDDLMNQYICQWEIKKGCTRNNIDCKACVPCVFYRFSLSNVLVNNLPQAKSKNEIFSVKQLLTLLAQYKNEKALFLRKEVSQLIAQACSSVGNTFINCFSKGESSKILHLNKSSMANMLDFITLFNTGNIEGVTEIIEKDYHTNNFNQLNIVIYYYFLSSYFYKAAGKLKNSITQRNKILYLISGAENQSITREQYEKLKDSIIRTILKDNYSLYSFSHLAEINQLKPIYGSTLGNEKEISFFDWSDIKLQTLTINADILESLLLYNEIGLRSDLLENSISIDFSLQNHGTVYNKVMLLRQKVLLNYKALLDLNIFPENYNACYSNIEIVIAVLKLYIKDDNEKINKIEELIIDSIGCLTGIINLLNIYGTNYLINHSFKASIHSKLAYWSYIFEVYRYTKSISEFNADLWNRIIESDFVNKKRAKERKNIFDKQEEKVFNSLKEELFNSLAQFILGKEKTRFPVSFKIKIMESGLLDSNNKELFRIIEFSEFVKFYYKEHNNQFFNLMAFIRKNYSTTKIIASTIENDLEQRIGTKNLIFIKENYQTEIAIKEFYKAFETHNQGNSYREFIEDLYFLDSDFNDEMYLFNIAKERYFIQNGEIEKKIQNLKYRFEYTRVYEPNSYFTISKDGL